MKMRRKGLNVGLIFMLVLLVFSFYATGILADNQNSLTVSKSYTQSTIISEFYQIPVKFYLNITNHNVNDDYVSLYTLLNMNIFPNTPFTIKGGETINVPVAVYIKDRPVGKYTYTYYIKGNHETIKDSFSVKVVKLDDALGITMPPVSKKDDYITLHIVNNENVDFGNLTISSNDFIKFSKTITLGPKQEKDVNITLDENNIGNVKAGMHTISLLISVKGTSVERQELVNVEEYKNLKQEVVEKKSFLIYETTLTKTNIGNSKTTATLSLTMKPFTKAFTRFSIKPTSIIRYNNNVIAVWQKQLQPNEAISVKATTNYLWPIILLIVIIAAVLFVWKLSKEKVKITKKVTKLKARPKGITAFRVTLNILNKGSTIEDMVVTDMLPGIMNLYEKETKTKTKPKINGNKVLWKIGQMLNNEEHILSYVIYSKIKLLGKLELPKTKVEYVDEKGQKHKTYSNSVMIINPEA